MEDNMVKLDEILEAVKYKEAAKKKEEKKNCILWILAIIGIVAAVAAVAYAVYRYLTRIIWKILTTTLTMILRTRIWTRKNLKKASEEKKRGLRIAETYHQEQTDHGFECLNSLWFGTVGTRFGSVQIKLYRVAHAGDDRMFLRERKNQKFRFSWGHPVL